MTTSATELIRETYKRPFSLTRRETEKTICDETAADSNNHFIWALAAKFTNSSEEAEAAVREMHADIEKCEKSGVQPQSDEDRIVARIAWRRLLEFMG